PELVPKEELLAAMSLGSAQFNLGRVVGPALAGVAILAGSYSLVFAINAASFGAVIIALLMSRFAERPHDPEQTTLRRVIVADLALVLPATIVLYATAPSLWTAATALVAVGAAYIGVLSGLMTVVQLRAPDHLRARILSLYMVALGVVYPIGAVIQGKLGDEFGLRRSEEHTSELQSQSNLVCRLLLENKNSHAGGKQR